MRIMLRQRAGTNERGSALIGVLLLLLVMSALAAALGVSGQTEATVARNHQTLAQARTAAEAGLNEAAQVTIAYLRTIDPALIPATLNSLLLDTTPLVGATFGAAEDLEGVDDPEVEYEVLLMDEDDPDRGLAATLTDFPGTDDDEDNDESTDANGRIVIRATGRARGNASVTLEALLAPVELGAIVTDGDLDISGNVTVTSTTGDPDDADVHSNGDLDIDGSATVSGDMTASGAYDGPPGGEGGQPKKPLPKIRAEDYKHHALYVLSDTGLILCNQTGGCGAVGYGGTVCDPGNNGNGCRTSYGWEYNAKSGWSATSSGNKVDGAFYVEGKATITASHGTPAAPWLITVIAEGSIDLSGSPDLSSYTNELLFVTDADLDISGGVSTSIVAQGQMLVHEQISFSGTVTLGGQVIVEDSASVDPLVETNSISGTVVIDYNGGLGTNQYFVVGWREVR